MKEGEEIPALVLLVSTLFADDHQIVEDEQCPLVSLAKVWTSAQIQDFLDVALQNKTTLRSGEFLEGERGGREREREREKIKHAIKKMGSQASIHITELPRSIRNANRLLTSN